MAEYEVPVKVVGIRYACDHCGEEMTRSGALTHVNNPLQQVPHQCINGHTKKLDRVYPFIKTEILELPEEDRTFVTIHEWIIHELKKGPMSVRDLGRYPLPIHWHYVTGAAQDLVEDKKIRYGADGRFWLVTDEQR